LVEENSEAEDEAMIPEKEITTPDKVQQLQRTLYRKAKENKRWRAWSLYGDLCRRDVLEAAVKAVVSNAGAAGEDGVSTEAIKAAGNAFLDELQTQLHTKSYRPSPVLRVWIPKADGKKRPLGIPTVKDRVVQTAMKLLLEPIFEADFDEGSYGYRPNRDAHQAIEAIKTGLFAGETEIIDADLSGYFDTVDHAAVLKLVARRVSDGAILRLVKLFLKAPIVEEEKGKRSIHPNDRGTPQGGVISPLLANLYLNSLDHGVNDHPELEAKLVRYADDFVLLCRPGRAPGLQVRLKAYLEKKGLKLNEAKTRILDARRESFCFLGFQIRWQRSWKTGNHYPHAEPSQKARKKLRASVRKVLNHWTQGRSCVGCVTEVNQAVRGWGQYFHYGNCTTALADMQYWLEQRLRRWLWRKYGRSHALYSFLTADRLHGQYGLFQLPTHAPYLR